MKWRYQHPLVEIERLDDKNIICTSGLMNDDNYSGEDGGEL